MRRLKINTKGSFTVEASIVFATVFLLIAAMIYVFIIMYQYTVLQSTANQVANSGAYYYVQQNSKSNLYWRLFDRDEERKNNYLLNLINKNLNKSILKSDRSTALDTNYKLLTKQLNISICDKYFLPIGSLFSVFGISPTIEVRVDAKSPLDDNSEFIRNMDTVIDIKNSILNSDSKWIGKDSKVNEVLEKLLKKN